MANVPGYGAGSRATGSPAYSGTQQGGDPTTEPGQYPGTMDHGIFGGPLPTSTGAPGSAGGRGSGGDPTVEPGQLTDGLTGVSDRDIANTGAPGGQGASNSENTGPDSVTFTRPSAGINTYDTESVRDSVSGSQDWTSANDQGYSSGGPQLPGIRGNEPKAGEGPYQPGSGRVLRGGRYHG